MSRYRENKKLSGVIYMHRISDVRLSGISRRNFRMFRALCGDATLRSVVIVTNMWSLVTPDVGAAREHELTTDPVLFKPALDAGARMTRHRDTLESAHAILGMLVANAPVVLRIQQEIVDERKTAAQTGAQAEIDSEEMQKARKQQEEQACLQREAAAAALHAQQEQQAREVEAQRQRAAAEAARVEAERERVRREQEAVRLAQEAHERALQQQREAEAAARRAEEERIRQVQLEAQRIAQEAEAARQRAAAELARMRRRHRNDCIIC